MTAVTDQGPNRALLDFAKDDTNALWPIVLSSPAA
jgi:hypothetical protein